jgi:CubicO group peptidase (beta-lactamase class C family)
MKKQKLLIFLLIIFVCAGCLKDENLKEGKVTYLPEKLNDGWETDTVISRVFEMNTLNEVINDVYSNSDFLLIHGFIVVKGGKLMVESYPRGISDRNTPHHLWSTTKSFISVLTGIALDEGYIHSVDDSVFKYIPEYLPYAYPELKSLTLEECLTMRSGIDYDNDGWEEEEVLALVPDDLTRYILERPMKSKPGAEAVYKNSDPQLMSKLISDAAKTDLVEFANQHLFAPLQITDYYWSRHKDNTPYGGFGLYLTPRDLAKFGQMLLDNGRWKNQRIVSEKWIGEATKSRTEIVGIHYGYYFWIDKQKEYFWTWGAGGQFVFVVPGKDLVVVITSEQNADNANTTIEQATFIVDKIIESVNG